MPVSYPSTDDPYPPMERGLEYGLQTWTIKTPAGDVEASRGDNSWSYEGTGDSLIAAGIAEPSQIPGNPRCSRKRWFNRRQMIRFGKQVRFNATRYRYGIVRVYIAKTDAQEAHDKAEGVIARFPSSSKKFRARMLSLANVHLDCFFDSLGKDGYGYHFDEKPSNQIRAAADDLINAIEQGRIVLDRGVRDTCVTRARATAAKDDPQFHAFLAITAAAAGATQNG